MSSAPPCTIFVRDIPAAPLETTPAVFETRLLDPGSVIGDRVVVRLGLLVSGR